MPFAERSLAAIDEATDAEALLAHPFLVGWRDGKLTRDDLRAFATQYFHMVASFPRMASTVHSITRDASIRRTLVSLLDAVELRTPTPTDLWLQTCASIGLFSDSVRQAECTNATEACLNDFFYLCQQSPASGLATLNAWLRMQPTLCRMQGEALVDHYGMHAGPGLAFFESYGYLASNHTPALRMSLERAIDGNDAARDARGAAEAAAVALRGMCAGVVGAAIR
jgi:pyrroloquinoline-quinone synthase